MLLTGCSSLSGFGPSPPRRRPDRRSPSAVPLGPAFGDVAPRESITDDLGTYLHVTISPGVRRVPHGRSGHPRPVDQRQLVGRPEPPRGAALHRDLRRRADHRLQRARPRRSRLGGMGRLDLGAYFGPDEDDLMKLEGRTGRRRLQRPRQLHAASWSATGSPAWTMPRSRSSPCSNEPREGGEWLTITGIADVAYRLERRGGDRARLLEQGYDQDEAEGFDALGRRRRGHYLTTLPTGATRSSAVSDGWLIRAYELDLGVDHRGRLAGLSRPRDTIRRATSS